jgi:hypothetical protein
MRPVIYLSFESYLLSIETTRNNIVNNIVTALSATRSLLTPRSTLMDNSLETWERFLSGKGSLLLTFCQVIYSIVNLDKTW